LTIGTILCLTFGQHCMCALATLYMCVFCLLRLVDYPVCMARLQKRPLWWCYVVLIFLLFSWTMAIIMVSTIYFIFCDVYGLICPNYIPPNQLYWSVLDCRVRLYLLYNVGCVWESCYHWSVRPKGINSVFVVNLFFWHLVASWLCGFIG